MSLSIQSVMHVNVNCSDLEQSLAFYRDAVGLVPQDHTNPVPQDGAGFGMTGSVQWDAHILQDARGYAGPAVDLLQWMVPVPVGAPGQVLSHIGFNRLCVVVPDVDESQCSQQSPLRSQAQPQRSFRLSLYRTSSGFVRQNTTTR